MGDDKIYASSERMYVCVCVGRLKESVAGDMTCQCYVGVSDTGVHTGHWHLFTHSLSLVLGKWMKFELTVCGVL